MDLLDKYVIDGNLESIRIIINNGNNWKLDTEYNDYNLLKKALIYEHKEITKFFIANDFRVNKLSLDDADTTPLHIAIKLEWKDIVLLLLEKGASVEVPDKVSKLTPIQLSFFMKKYELTDLMLPFDKAQSIDRDCDDINPDHLYIACARNCVSVVKNYLFLGEDVNKCVGKTFLNWLGYTPLHFAVDFQSRETVGLLLKCGASITIKDKRKNTPLHLALTMQDESLIDLLLSEHRYFTHNPKNLYKVSHFHIACTRNKPKVVYGFLQCGVDINKTVKDGLWKGYSALHLAAIHQCVDVIKLLLSQDNLKKDYSEEFLFDVYKTENSEIINLITSRNKTPLPKGFSGKIPLKPLFRACIKKDEKEIKSLLSSGVPVNEQLPLDSLLLPGATPLHILVAHNFDSKYEIISLMLENGANVMERDARGLTPIHIAFQEENVYHFCTRELLKNYSNIKNNISDEDGLSLFHIACAIGDIGVVDWFLGDVGVDVNAAVSEESLRYPGYTPLHMAAMGARMEVFRKLLNHGANIIIKNRQGLSPFNLFFKKWSACVFPHKLRIIMSDIIKAYRRDDTMLDGLEYPLLHAACICFSIEDMAEYFVKDQTALLHSAQNSALNSTCGWCAGFTPLHFAVLNGNVKIIQMLLDHGADPAALSAEGDTPLHMSLRHLEKQIYDYHDTVNLSMPDFDVRLFLLPENPFGSCGLSHFHIACLLGKLDVVKAYLDHGFDDDIRTLRPHSLKTAVQWWEFNGHSWFNETGLHAAMRFGHREVVLLLLERGADANALDAFQQTPLHKILRLCDHSTIKLLVENGGADVNACDFGGQTPLHLACRRDVTGLVVEAFLEAGADINLMDKCGNTPLNIAAEYHILCPNPQQLIAVMEHVLRLKVAGCPISQKNVEALESSRQDEWYEFDESFESLCCSEELQLMTTVRLNEMMTLSDALRIRNAHQLQMLTCNKVLQRLVEEELSGDEKKTGLDDFPIYGYLVRLQFRRGWKRRQMTPEAVVAIRKLVENYCARFPDDCAVILLSYLADDDWERVTQAAK